MTFKCVSIFGYPQFMYGQMKHVYGCLVKTTLLICQRWKSCSTLWAHKPKRKKNDRW